MSVIAVRANDAPIRSSRAKSTIGQSRLADHALLHCMSNHISYLKARYCRSVMTTAANGSDDGARHLITCLTTEIPTTGTSSLVYAAERDALAAIAVLSDRMLSRTVAAAVVEWRHASEAILRWVNTADRS